MRRHLMIVLAGAALAVPAAADLTSANAVARDGAGVPAGALASSPDTTLRYRFPARPGVCGSGEQIWILDEDGGRSYYRNGRQRVGQAGEPACERGPVHVTLSQRDGRITDVTIRVSAPRPDGAWTDLDAAAAVDLLLGEPLLQRSEPAAGRDLVFATVLADAPSWPRLLQIARSRTTSDDIRKGAVFWLGQSAGDRVVQGLAALAGDDDDDLAVREAAVFSLYQMRDAVGIEPLIEIARTHSQPRIRRSAMFWLGQSGDPRALQFFESVLRG